MATFDIRLTTPLAERLITLYAEYVEGMINSSCTKYNELIKTATKLDLLYIAYRTPFERHCIKLVDILGIDNVPGVLRAKYNESKLYCAKMDALTKSFQ